MPLDAIFLNALTLEFVEKLRDAKISKIQQPEKETLVFVIRGRENTHKLLFSISGGVPRLHLTQAAYENPQTPPMFCMLLRKHLLGGKILSVTQVPMERILKITIGVYDEFGEYVSRHLVLELMGPGSNLILVGADGRITDCLRRNHSEKRSVLPGLYYREPPAQDKKNILEVPPDEFIEMAAAVPSDTVICKWLQNSFLGLSPLICRELAQLSCGEADARFGDMPRRAALTSAAESLTRQIREQDFTPWMLVEGKRPFDFSYLPITQYGTALTLEEYPDFSGLLEEFYIRRAQGGNEKTKSLIKTVENLRDRTAKKLALQKQELSAAENRERLRQIGDIITANLYQIKKGADILRAENFYEPEGGEIEIKLDPLKSPQQNAAKYYKDYTKAKTAQTILTQQLIKGETELGYLESVLDILLRTETEREMNDVRQELADSGFIKKRKGVKEKSASSSPHTFYSTAGIPIYVGKNNLQNDRLTLKTARGDDIWLHTQKIHGSHVILSAGGRFPDEDTLLEAAKLAAYYSQGREGTNVPVDYTQVKYVKKPAGGKPGMVVYTHFKTLYVTPDEALVRRLTKSKEQSGNKLPN